MRFLLIYDALLSRIELILKNLSYYLISTINSTTSANYGTITESNLQVKLSEIDEEVGIGFKVQVDLAGPVLEEIKENGSVLYPDKFEDDIYCTCN